MYSPPYYNDLVVKSQEMAFTMSSDFCVGALLKTLVASKNQASFLELGTGAGLSLSWMVAGMDKTSSITTIDNNPSLTAMVDFYFKEDKRVSIICGDGGEWIDTYQSQGKQFDLIFADTWAGKYTHLQQTLELLKLGGFYIVDDMKPQHNWSNEHKQKASNLLTYLKQREHFSFTYLDYSTGIIIMTKILL